MGTAEEVKRQIEKKVGFFPPYFYPALNNGRLLAMLWAQMLVFYVDNKLPKLTKELLFSYLSINCGNPYCLIVHSCKLTELGLRPEQIECLFSDLEKMELDKEVKDLLRISHEFYIHPERARIVVPKIKRLLGNMYGEWVKLVAFITFSHKWTEAHGAEITYVADKTAKDHLDELVVNSKKLRKIFRIHQM